ncbi:MAG: ergothioneine biosynthesis protein EgtB [Candidatus Dadabacteria bacterium]|nr:ergothioneine biosynthesis protein EgtB [Candidatus Dadabacteria bacterium]NIS09544.1 ergothioneine biosynthesis protein EgtB [Candidatus Dadabacteria bacterium]NIV42756.1 ergothioneine biosynthesis protein EgtB [Candidatus Dadabacteria bacterium]NIX16650.1 ergothioneine biosynthesis protein EgtB [Candidatus Dadabacteria bacterium]NIY23191.1 ergothioneine biosynthesis protein EgtB [Candidatus Dadabacteria bacterium]
MSKRKFNRDTLFDQFTEVRKFSEHISSPLCTEDYVIQSMPDVSPTKWHLAHTSWFFEAFVLEKFDRKYESLHPQYNYLFNSYYTLVGERHSRPKRGLISRPTVDEVYKYRDYVNKKIEGFFSKSSEKEFQKYGPVIEIGVHHERQHQELMLTDIKHVFSENPLRPIYLEAPGNGKNVKNPKHNWVSFPEGLYEIGHTDDSFCYDNETPSHKRFLNAFSLSSRLVTNKEYIEFIEDGGYSRPELWLSNGIYTAEDNGWQAPLYWEKEGGKWHHFTLSGFKELDPNEPVCHVSFYEADAFARWSGARLPTEAEWEIASADLEIEGNFVENAAYHPVPLNGSSNRGGLSQMHGDVWEWTSSPYVCYPGYKTLPGALGEYNGKFMSNQMVLRGGSCATSITHIRNTYRNFFPPDSRWQFMGIRLAKDEA